ncbi:MAG: hypothetical protein ACR2PL_06285 [Dehalococcoidia bacterium]
MLNQPEKLSVTPGSELARRFEDARTAGAPLVVEVNGHTYRLTPDKPEDFWEGYDAAKVDEVLDRHAGILTEEEAGRMIDTISSARAGGSRAANRP